MIIDIMIVIPVTLDVSLLLRLLLFIAAIRTVIRIRNCNNSRINTIRIAQTFVLLVIPVFVQ